MFLVPNKRIHPRHLKKYFFIILYVLAGWTVVFHLSSSSLWKEFPPQKPLDRYPVLFNRLTDWEDFNQKSKKIDAMIKAAALRHDIDPSLIKAIIPVENRFNHRAVSPRGAVGHLRFGLDFFEGDRTLALAAYNAGLRRVLNYEKVPPFQEIPNYIQKVLIGLQYYSQQKKG